MIGLDTNVLVRYLTLDDPLQSPRAARIIEQRLSVDQLGYVSAIVVVELVWVLDRAYGWDREVISEVVERLLAADLLVLEHAPQVFTAMMAIRETNADFADALIGALNTEAGCFQTLTFDRRALRLPGFEAP